MIHALVTQMLNALEHHQSQTRPIHKTEFAITAAREYLATKTGGERAELIKTLNNAAYRTDDAVLCDTLDDAADMLEADAQQAKRVPMTPQEIRDWWASENKLEDCEMCKLHDFETVVRAVERRHKITPAQKPTDWSAA